MRKMKDSGVEWIGEVPEEWEVSRLKYAVKYRDGERVNIDRCKRKAGPYPYWGAGKVIDHVDSYLFDEKLILLGGSGAPFFDKKRDVAFYVNEKVWVNSDIHVLQANKNVCPEFLTHYLNVVEYTDFINGAIIKHLTQTNMNNIPVVLPPLSDQLRIADFLDRKCSNIDGIVVSLKKNISSLKEYKKSIITKAVTKGLDDNVPMKDSGVEWIGEVPEGWKVKRLKYVLESNMKYGATESGVEFSSDLPRYIRITDITNDGRLKEEGKLSLEEDKAEDYLLKKKTVLFARSGNSIGKTFLYKPDYGKAAFAGYLVSANTDNEVMTEEWLYYYTLSNLYLEWVNKNFNKATIPNISAQKYMNMHVITPPLSEQRRIADYLDRKCSKINALIESYEKQIELFTEYKKTMIYNYVTGKKEVPES